MPTAWIFDVNNMLYGSLFMLCGAYTLAQNAHVRGDFLYSSMRPRTQATLDLVLYIVFFIPGIAALDLRRLLLRRRILAHRRAFQRHRRRAAGLSLQVGHPDRRRPGDAAGLCRDRALRRLPARPANGRAGSRTSPRSTSSRSNSRTASMSTRNARKIAIERAQEIDETARQRGMGGDLQHMSDPALGLLMLALIVVVIMMGFPTAFTLMGLGMFFGFIAFYDPSQALDAQPRLRPDGPAHLRRDDQRRADLHPAVRADGLRDGARRAGRQDVLLDPACVPARAGLARRRDADRVHLLGHRQRPGRRGRGADGRHRLQSDAEGGLRRQARRPASSRPAARSAF